MSKKPVKELPACPVETTLTLIGDKWKVLILRDLLSGTKRFGELKRSIGSVSQKVLTAQLRAMEGSGLLTRTVYAEVPPRVEYSLTELGESLKPILDAMWNWGEGYKASLTEKTASIRLNGYSPFFSDKSGITRRFVLFYCWNPVYSPAESYRQRNIPIHCALQKDPRRQR